MINSRIQTHIMYLHRKSMQTQCVCGDISCMCVNIYVEVIPLHLDWILNLSELNLL